MHLALIAISVDIGRNYLDFAIASTGLVKCFPCRGGGVERLVAALANITPFFLPSKSLELDPVEGIWRYMGANWLSNRVFETYDGIIEAACEAWNKLIALPDAIKSIGMRDGPHISRSI